VNGYLKKLKHQLDYKFSGDSAIQDLDFLSTFKEAGYLNRISEGIAVLILPYFLEGRAKSGVSSRLKQAAASLPKFPVAIQWYCNHSPRRRSLLRRFRKSFPQSRCRKKMKRLMPTG
jgi:hypothetical protein